jgi:hypothetical protein
LTVFFEIYHPSVVKEEPNVEVRIRLFRQGEETATVIVDNLRYLTEAQLDKISFAQTFSLSKLSPGYYELEVEVIDTPTGRTAKERQTFEVL